MAAWLYSTPSQTSKISLKLFQPYQSNKLSDTTFVIWAKIFDNLLSALLVKIVLNSSGIKSFLECVGTVDPKKIITQHYSRYIDFGNCLQRILKKDLACLLWRQKSNKNKNIKSQNIFSLNFPWFSPVLTVLLLTEQYLCLDDVSDVTCECLI